MSVFPSVCLSVCHTRESRLNGLRYRNRWKFRIFRPNLPVPNVGVCPQRARENQTQAPCAPHYVNSLVGCVHVVSPVMLLCNCFMNKLEIRSVERGICPIATSTINERTIPIIMAGCMTHEREGYISTSGLKSDVTIVFLDPDFLQDAQISAIRPWISVILRIFHCACAKRPYYHFRSKIWRHHRVPRPRFPIRRANFGDSRTFKADILLLRFQDLLA